MPFVITEPQKINGTTLGFSVYPYHFSFSDNFKSRDFNQKLVVFKLKDSKFIEIDEKVFEVSFADHKVERNFVEKTLKNFVVENPKYITNPQEVVDCFITEKNFSAEKTKEKIF